MIRSRPIAPIAILAALSLTGVAGRAAAEDRPNILFAFADDWGVHASAYGTEGIETPHFDRIAKEGVRFQHAFVSVPSCTPSRGSILTGQHAWRLGPGANLHSTLPAKFPVYPWLLKRKAGYFVGHTRKGWGPGRYDAGGREKRPAGPRFDSFDAFLKKRPDDKPFCFWFGSTDPHRDYSDALRKKMGIAPDDVEVPPYLPDVPTVRKDIANYYAEVQRFDRDVGRIMKKLKKAGELSETLVVMTGDHGWPFPRGKSHLYDAGARVPLAIRWPEEVKAGRVVTDFVSLVDLAPTFLEAAGVSRPAQMTGDSLMGILRAKRGGRVADDRSSVVLAKERHHGLCRPDGKAYPSRAIRTEHFLYIRNFKPDRWPAGSPRLSSSQHIFSDTDNGPTKKWMIAHANEPEVRPLFKQCFAKRPAVELYDLRKDPHQMNNVAEDPDYAQVRRHLGTTLEKELRALEDPRVTGGGEKFSEYPYYTGYGVEKVEPPESVKKALDLE